MKFLARLIALGFVAFSGSNAGAAIIVKAVELGDDVVIAGFGSISLADLGEPILGGTTNAFIRADQPSLALGVAMPESTDRYSGAFTVRPTFGPGPGLGPASLASSGVGDKFGLSSFTHAGLGILPSLLVPTGYTSDAPLSFSSVFEDATFDSLGIVAGDYEFGLSNGETIRLEARPDVAIEIVVEEIGGDVIMTGSGAVRLGDFGTPILGGTTNAFIRADQPSLALGVAVPESTDRYSGAFTFGSSFGPGPGLGPASLASSGVGDKFGLSTFTHAGLGILPSLLVPAGYLSGELLDSMSIFEGATLATLGIVEGIYLFGLSDGQTISLRAVAAAPHALPLPASALLVATGLLILTGRQRRWRRS